MTKPGIAASSSLDVLRASRSAGKGEDMNTLLLLLLSLAAVCTLFGILRLILDGQDFNDQRRFFDHRAEGRKKARSTSAIDRPGGWSGIRRF